jgi:hypothetical protein
MVRRFMKNLTVIFEACYNLSQSWFFERIVSIPQHKLWIKIERNAYDNQSWARVKRWSGTSWENVYEEPIILCDCKYISYVNKDVKIQAFELDYNRLLNTTLKIIN